MQDIHSQATVLVLKALQCDANERLTLVQTILSVSNLSDANVKKVQELVRKACEARDKIALNLYNVELVDPRQLPLGFDDVRPDDFAEGGRHG